ncbi:MAG: TerC/Alx family metal homeostasis membrane protein [Alphaproteobacteria bacterium]|nr:TerC/Alx family metal homeostasis membrane protein [Alphaproteobacteria bacterium]
MDGVLFYSVFNIVIILLVIADLLFPPKNVIFLTFLWIFLGLSFSAFVYIQMGVDHFYEYLSAYFIEKSLSVDNIFVFLLIFERFKIESRYQKDLLFVGIWGALILRAFMIFAVSEILSAFHFMTYIFGLFIFIMGTMSFIKNNNSDYDKILNLQKYFNVFQGDHQGRFFIKEDNGKWKMTILVVVVICIEICDIIFAFDSIPAIFSITDNKAIIYTSNAFAIIGLRSLYLAFEVAVNKFNYLKHGVGIILLFIGAKMILTDYYSISPLASFLIIIGILLGSFCISVINSIRQEEK